LNWPGQGCLTGVYWLYVGLNQPGECQQGWIFYGHLQMEVGTAETLPGLNTATCVYLGNTFYLFGGKDVEC
jgi:hypothetical protein